MPYFRFTWSSQAVGHITQNDVSQEDFEEVVCNPVDRDVSRYSGLPVAFGYTEDGRYVMAVYRQIDELTVEPVTAFVVPEPRW